MAKCEQCDKEMNPSERMLGPVCGNCARINHSRVTRIGGWFKQPKRHSIAAIKGARKTKKEVEKLHSHKRKKKLRLYAISYSPKKGERIGYRQYWAYNQSQARALFLNDYGNTRVYSVKLFE